MYSSSGIGELTIARSRMSSVQAIARRDPGGHSILRSSRRLCATRIIVDASIQCESVRVRLGLSPADSSINLPPRGLESRSAPSASTPRRARCVTCCVICRGKAFTVQNSWENSLARLRSDSRSSEAVVATVVVTEIVFVTLLCSTKPLLSV